MIDDIISGLRRHQGQICFLCLSVIAGEEEKISIDH
jgi:hypothetical protein